MSRFFLELHFFCFFESLHMMGLAAYFLDLTYLELVVSLFLLVW